QANARMGLTNTQAIIDDLAKRLAGDEGSNREAYLGQINDAEKQMKFYRETLATATKAQPTAQRLFRGSEYLIDWMRAVLPLIAGVSALGKLCAVLPGY